MSGELQSSADRKHEFRQENAENIAESFFQSIQPTTDAIEFALDEGKLARFYEGLGAHTDTIDVEAAGTDGRATATVIIQNATQKNFKLWRIVQVLSTLALPREGECHIPDDLVDSELTLSDNRKYAIKFIRTVRKGVLEESKRV